MNLHSYKYSMKYKLDEFIKRNRKRNSHLYESGLIEGEDFVVCPVSKQRLSMIKSSYIEQILGMTVDEYDKLYPGCRRVSQRRRQNIQKGLQLIDESTGLTKHRLACVKSAQTLNKVNKSGKSGYKRKGEKTRATHLANIDTLGRNGYSRIATKAILKGNKTKAENGLISLNKTEFDRYKQVILYLSGRFRKELTDGFVTGLAGTKNAWHIDHRYSILKGYQNKVSPLIIGHRKNLEMVPWRNNIVKGSSCSISLDQLLNECGCSKEKSMSDFDRFICLINEDIKNNVPPNGGFLVERFYGTELHNQ